jgi:hypothetical protein
MPCLSGSFNPAIGLLINVGILPAGTLRPGSAPPIPLNTFPALVDTGATVTCIAPSVVQHLGLQPIGMRAMVSATQTIPVPIYLVDLILPFGNTGFVLSSTQVMEFAPAGGSPFQILVGRDVICQGILTLSFDGRYTFSI